MGARPRYESADDRTRELAVAQAVFDPYGVTLAKLPVAYEADFAVVRGERVIGVAEVKVRSRAYETLLLSLHKAQSLRGFAQCGLRAWLLLCVPSGVYVRRVEPWDLADIRMGGRTDRGDWQDVEPVVHVPMLGMKRVADVPEGCRCSP